jgi:hypothetical protein
MNGTFGVFHAGVEPADIRQGALADCWLQCSLSGLAEFPELVEVFYLFMHISRGSLCPLILVLYNCFVKF